MSISTRLISTYSSHALNGLLQGIYGIHTVYKLKRVRCFSIFAFHSHDKASSPSLPARPMPLSTRRSLSVHRGCEFHVSLLTQHLEEYFDPNHTPSSCRPTLIPSTPLSSVPSADWTLFSVSRLSRNLGETCLLASVHDAGTESPASELTCICDGARKYNRLDMFVSALICSETDLFRHTLIVQRHHLSCLDIGLRREAADLKVSTFVVSPPLPLYGTILQCLKALSRQQTKTTLEIVE